MGVPLFLPLPSGANAILFGSSGVFRVVGLDLGDGVVALGGRGSSSLYNSKP
jgi:hypothetical protein